MSESKEAKAINIPKTVEYLNRSFREVCRDLPLAQTAGTFNVKEEKFVRWENPTERDIEGEQHYRWQTDMAYMIDNIQRGPTYIIPKLIADANKLIEDIKSYKKSREKSD